MFRVQTPDIAYIIHCIYQPIAHADIAKICLNKRNVILSKNEIIYCVDTVLFFNGSFLFSLDQFNTSDVLFIRCKFFYFIYLRESDKYVVNF